MHADVRKGSVTVTFSDVEGIIFDDLYEIKEYMELGYLPEGFELRSASEAKTRNSKLYSNDEIKNGVINFEQFIAPRIRYSTTYYSDDDLYLIYYKDYEILTVDGGERGKKYFWTDGEYGYALFFEFYTENDELALRVIEGIRVFYTVSDAENGEK